MAKQEQSRQWPYAPDNSGFTSNPHHDLNPLVPGLYALAAILLAIAAAMYLTDNKRDHPPPSVPSTDLTSVPTSLAASPGVDGAHGSGHRVIVDKKANPAPTPASRPMVGGQDGKATAQGGNDTSHSALLSAVSFKASAMTPHQSFA
ncbi:hypothetical protein [Micromonospora sp. WMMD1274]|uniref:hypothetical protein n=1 Tax=Micromonospora sp. WMMD1274 TaxID=3404116 RepID=UPI003B9361B8